MPDLLMSQAVVHHPLIDRFAIECEGRRIAFLSYTLERRRTMTIDVIRAPGEYGPLAGVLLAAAITWGREQGYTVLGFCPDAQAYLRREREPAVPAAA